MFKNLYFKRIFAVLLLIGIIPVIALMAAVSSMTSAQNEFLYEVQNTSIVNKRKQIEVSLEYVNNSMIRAGLSGTLTSGVRKKREAKNFQDFNQINDQLNLLNSSIFPVNDIILASLQQDWVMNPESFTTIEDSAYRGLIERLKGIRKSSFWHYDEEFVYLVERIPVNSVSGNSLLISKIDKTILQYELDGDSQDEGVVILDEDGRCLVGRPELASIVEYVRASEKKWDRLLEGNAVQTAFHHENYLCAASKSDLNGWTYISVTLNSDLKQGVESVYRTMWFVIFSVLIIVLILVIRFSKLLYHPIGEINDLVDSNLSDHEDEFAEENGSITSKVNYLVKKNVELKKKLSDREEYEREIYLRKIYRNELSGITSEELMKHGVITRPIDGEYIHVMGIKYYHKAETSKDMEVFLFGLKNIITELTGSENIFAPVVMDHVIYITHYENYMSAEGAMLQLNRTCEMIISAVAQYMGVGINIGVSRPIFEAAGIPEAAEECNLALRKVMGQFGACIFWGVNEEKHVVLSEIKIKQKRLQIIQSLLEGKEELCRKHLDEYFEKMDGVEYYLFKLEVNKLLSDILDCYNEYSIKPDYSKMKEITDFDITKNVDSIEKLKLHLWNHFLQPFNQKVQEPVENQRVIDEIAEYLKEHIEQDISLDQCARYFNYNPNYLSRMFKKLFGKTYTEYMIDKKIERCKELLSETDLSINEISVRLGYNSPQNFIRVFKKYTLMTPGQYRSQQNLKKEGKD
ncbi:helix-turn-helix domain-containing protein [Clostridium sp. MCC353]|uniref:helix-turn-helix transcriptional regulator n=1 Tax=Clostridium sp. MCC353 TaxID=2592646 RepID=UPI001C02DD30|nr:AraC family transcriptional regulator [Clostridium sp. MCC353]MBT9780022.1 helix-turn-helix domain-containing protein [Clostridium sp. MCC353]